MVENRLKSELWLTASKSSDGSDRYGDYIIIFNYILTLLEAHPVTATPLQIQTATPFLGKTTGNLKMEAVDKEGHLRTSHCFLMSFLLIVYRFHSFSFQFQCRQPTSKGDDGNVTSCFISNCGDRCYNSLQLLLATCLKMVAED